MSKKTKARANRDKNIASDLGRGVIKDNFLAALVTSKVYKQQVVAAKKAKAHISVSKSIKDKSLI